MNKNTETAILNPPHQKHPDFDPPLNLGVLASGNGTNFEALVNACNLSKIKAKISVLIVNNENCGAIKRASRLKIPHLIINHKKFSSRSELDSELIKKFSEFEVEGIVMAGWMRIVTPVLIDQYPGRLINIHPSLLPSFRGINSVERALEAGVKITGCSVHLVEQEVDTGEILIQAAVPILQDDDVMSLTKRIQEQEHKILPEGICIAGRRWRCL